MLRCDLPLRSDTGALAKEGRLSETRMYKTSRPFYYQNHKRSREHKAPAPTTDSLDLSNYCPSDLILKRIYLRRTATAHSFTVGRPRTTPFAAHAELLVIVSVLSCCSACPNQHVNESACSERKFRDKLSLNQAHGGSKLSSQLSHFTHHLRLQSLVFRDPMLQSLGKCKFP